MIEEKLKMAAEKLPRPQSNFRGIIKIAAPKPKDGALRDRISRRVMRCLIVVKNEYLRCKEDK